MATLSITASEVVKSSNANDIDFGSSGEAIAIGQVVYRKSDNLIYKAHGWDVATAAALGIATCACSAAGQNIAWQKSGTLVLGASASVAQGQVYVLTGEYGSISNAAGPYTFVTILGVGDADDGIVIPSGGPIVSGVASA